MNNEALKIYFFYCSNSLDAKELSQCYQELKDYNIKAICLPCSGKIDIPYLVKAFETGADGIVIVTCELGQCRHLEGNMRAEKRAEAVDSLLEEVGAGTGRITAFHIKEGQIKQTIEKIKTFCLRIKKVKPEPAAQGI
jgi:coenzyme F420-reducing hydrogenase delta subunit